MSFSRPTPRAIGLTLTLIIAALALAAPLLAPADPTTLHLSHTLQSPGEGFWLGTDALGRDVLSRLLYGARTSLSVGLVAVGLAVGLGVAIGALAATGPRWADNLLMRATDAVLCFPTIFLILAVITLLTPSLMNVMVVIGLTGWMGTARLVRAEVLSLKSRAFVEAARLAGVGPWQILLRHLLPNALPPILTSASLGLAGAILTEAGLSFLGLGIQPPTPSWGSILNDGKDVLDVAWWLTAFPSVCIVVTTLGFTLLGEPTLKRSR